jgi:PAS domain S-box-containing protein
MANFSLETAGDAIFWIEPDGHFFFANEEASRMLGYSNEELLSMKVSDVDLNYSGELISEIWEDLKRRHHVVSETMLRTKDGKNLPVEISTSFLKYEKKELACSYVRDITGRKKVERLIRMNEERYRLLLENAGPLILTVNVDGVVLMVNKSAADFLGRKREECLGRTISRIFPPKMADFQIEHIRKVIQTGKGLNIEHSAELKEGKRHFIINIQPIEDPQTPSSSVMIIAHDITNRVQMETKLKQNIDQLKYMEMMYKAILLSTPHGLCMLTPDWMIVWANHSLKKILDPKNQWGSFEGLSFRDFFAEKKDFKEYRRAAIESIRKSGSDLRPVSLVRQDGGRIQCEISIVRLDPSQTGPGLVVTISLVRS